MINTPEDYQRQVQYEMMRQYQNAYQQPTQRGLMGGMLTGSTPQRQTTNSDDSEKLLLLTEDV